MIEPLNLDDGSVLSVAMIQIYASQLVALNDHLSQLEAAAKTWAEHQPGPEIEERVGKLLVGTAENCAVLRLRSAWKQLHTITEQVKTGTCSNLEFSQLIAELRKRIFEDLEDRAFFAITDTEKLDRYFTHDATQPGFIILKQMDKVYDPAILKRFDCIDDLIECSKCYLANCYTGCVFHLMRIVELGVMEVAEIAGLKDSKAGWGAVLSHVDKLCFRTEYKDLPTTVQPHRDLLCALSNEMHAIQRAWRNRVTHVENKLIPVKPIGEREIVKEIMVAVEVFMRSLAERLPAKG